MVAVFGSVILKRNKEKSFGFAGALPQTVAFFRLYRKGLAL